MAASGGCILDELQARMTALTDETPDAPRLFATTTALEDRVAELSAQHQDTSPTSKPKARAFAEDPPMVNSPQDIVNLASAPSSIASLSDSEKDEEDEEDASEAEQNLSDTEATKPKHKPKGSDPVPLFAQRSWETGERPLGYPPPSDAETSRVPRGIGRLEPPPLQGSSAE